MYAFSLSLTPIEIAAHGARSFECSEVYAVRGVMAGVSCGPSSGGGGNTTACESKAGVWKDSVCVAVAVLDDDGSVGSIGGESRWSVGEVCGLAIGVSDSIR